MTKRFEYYAYISFTYLHIEAFVETFLKKAGFSTGPSWPGKIENITWEERC